MEWPAHLPLVRGGGVSDLEENFLGFLKIEHSVQFRGFSINPKLNIFTYLESTRRDDHNGGWHVAGNRRTRRHAPPRALRTAARQMHAPDLF